jgi:hypothetical protein
MVPNQDCELLPQGKIFQKEAAARPNRPNDRCKQELTMRGMAGS